jgi:DNA topoisomerase-1
MAANLVIVESPSKAKTINKYLGKDFRVEASIGHIRDLPEKGDGAVDIEHDFAMSYVVPDKKKPHVAKLRKLAKEAEVVWLATDKDREGEAIAWHLLDELKIPASKVRRVVFNEITKKAIQAAFASPGQIDMNKVAAQEARRALDRLVGYPVSALVRTKVSGAESAGRVQTVAVRLIVEREREIRAFRAQDYWRVGAVLSRQEIGAAAKAAYDAFLAAHKANLAELATGGAADAEAEDKASDKAAESEELPEAGVTGAARKELDALLAKNKAFRAELFQFGPDRIATSAEAVKEKRGRILDAAAAKGIVDRLRPGPWAVSSVEKKERQDRPRPPFTTATLQQAASSQLRFPASKTMSLAQKLYEGVDLGAEGAVALITYMRTDSTFLSDDAIREGRNFIAGRFGQDAVPDKPNHYSPKATAQGAHEAIRPTEPARTPDSLRDRVDKDLLALYRLIWTRFIACQMKPAVWNVTEVQITAGAAGPQQGLFRTSGRELKSPGYTALTGVIDDEAQMLPPLAARDPLSLIDLTDTRHATQPPPRFTEAGLVKELEKQGIGRPSTYANIIQKIQDRDYVRDVGRKFVPTVLGETVVDGLVRHVPGTFDVRFTSEMEDKLDNVEAGKKRREDLLREFWKPFHDTLERAKSDMPFFTGKATEHKCVKCGAPLLLKLFSGRPALSCSRYAKDGSGCDAEIISVDAFGNIKEKGRETDVPCEKCGKPMILRSTSRGGRSSYFLGCSGYPECSNTKPCDENGVPMQVLTEEKLKELDLRCLDCGRPTAIKQGRFGPFLGCTGGSECKGIRKLPEGYYIPKPPPVLTGITCDKCGKPLAVKAFGGRKFLGCTGFPKCRNAKPYSLFESGYTGVAPKDTPKAGEAEDAEAATDETETDTATAETTAKAPAAKSKKTAKKTARKAAAEADGADGAEAKPAAKKATKKTAKKAARKAAADDTVADTSDDTLADAGTEAVTVPFDADEGYRPPSASTNGAHSVTGTATATAAKAPAKSAASAAPAPEGGKYTSDDVAMNPDAGDWGKCPNCGSALALKPGKWGPFLGCTGFPKCKVIVSLRGEAKKKAAAAAPAPPPKDPPQKTDIPCPECNSPMVVRKSGRGPFLGCSAYPKCKTTMPMPKDLKPAAAPATAGAVAGAGKGSDSEG